MRLRDGLVDARIVPAVPDSEITAWLGEVFVSWDGVLLMHNGDEGVRTAPVGWFLVRWGDGVITLSSPKFGARAFEPVEDQQ